MDLRELLRYASVTPAFNVFVVVPFHGICAVMLTPDNIFKKLNSIVAQLTVFTYILNCSCKTIRYTVYRLNPTVIVNYSYTTE